MKRTRSLVLLAILAGGALSAWELELNPGGLWPGPDRWEVIGRFFGAALSPALISEADHRTNVLPRVLEASANTVLFAAAAMSISLVLGLILGVLASESWWRGLGVKRGAIAWGFFRALIAFMRSVHELLWGLLLMAAVGLSSAAAVVAITIPYTGTLAKVFSEMMDEAPRDTAEALRATGASSLQVFAIGLMPRALPDMGAYAFYRFECALRSSAILGFFGFPTLGKFIYESFGELYFHEAWTYLYALFLLILVVEWWSGALRRRMAAA